MMSQKRRIPSYRIHKPIGQAVVRIDRHDRYLGKHDTKASKEKYHRLIAEWLSQSHGSAKIETSSRHENVHLSINELILAYWNFVETYYVKNEQPTDEQYGIRAALRRLVELYGRSPVHEFGPLALKAVRERMIQSGLSRGVINQNIGRIKRMFRWGVENELVPVDVHQALQAVAGLRKGRSNARETLPVRPVADDDVNSVLPFLTETLQAMIRFQLLTGCRPTEVCIIRPCDLDHTGNVWCYRPESHKTEHHDRERRIYVGPQAQNVLSPWLVRSADAFCFSPRESDNSNGRSSTTVRPTQRQRSNGRRPGIRYTNDSYRRAITRACDKAEISHWTPNQLRHNRATLLRARFGIEGAQTVLGHSQADVTQVYAERDFQLASRIMNEVG